MASDSGLTSEACQCTNTFRTKAERIGHGARSVAQYLQPVPKVELSLVSCGLVIGDDLFQGFIQQAFCRLPIAIQ
jgi:hypothetical protein